MNLMCTIPPDVTFVVRKSNARSPGFVVEINERNSASVTLYFDGTSTFKAFTESVQGFLNRDRAEQLIREAEVDLGVLSFGQKSDLLLDNLSYLRGSEDAHNLLNELGHRPEVEGKSDAN